MAGFICSLYTVIESLMEWSMRMSCDLRCVRENRVAATAGDDGVEERDDELEKDEKLDNEDTEPARFIRRHLFRGAGVRQS